VLPPSFSWAVGAMISDMEDMKTWVKAYVTGITNSQSTQKTRLDCVPTGKEGLRFGLGVGCTGGWTATLAAFQSTTQSPTICPVQMLQ
jgi:D-alanyl-D-alanine carboxypeptidase